MGLLVGPSMAVQHGGTPSILGIWCDLGELEAADTTTGGALPDLPVTAQEDQPRTGGTDRAFGSTRPTTSGVNP